MIWCGRVLDPRAAILDSSRDQAIHELSDRMREIFGLVVETYLERGMPVGSKALAGNISLSPASIRGVMQELEEIGLLTHPHTSAGRVPTERGLRLFVDGIMRTAAPDRSEREEIERASAGPADRGGLWRRPRRRCRACRRSRVVLGPGSGEIISSSSFRAMAPGRAVGDPGRPRRQRREPLLAIDSAISGPRQRGSNFANARLGGLTLGEAAARRRSRSSSARTRSTSRRPSWSRAGLANGARTKTGARC